MANDTEYQTGHIADETTCQRRWNAHYWTFRLVIDSGNSSDVIISWDIMRNYNVSGTFMLFFPPDKSMYERRVKIRVQT